MDDMDEVKEDEGREGRKVGDTEKENQVQTEIKK